MTDTELRASLAGSTAARRLLHDLGYFGHFLHVHAGGRNGKQHILAVLFQNDGHMAQSDLAKQSCVTSAALSEVIAKLEAEGLIIRTRSASDGRSLDIELTQAGADKAAEIISAKLRFEEEAFACLSDDEVEQLSDMISRLAAHWAEIDAREREAATGQGVRNTGKEV